ncbi:NCS2 family permease [Caldanaerobius polysaccharolyticus]|nr:NCS2 family permease [Caldanaerobius polysaccharolyticus]
MGCLVQAVQVCQYHTGVGEKPGRIGFTREIYPSGVFIFRFKNKYQGRIEVESRGFLDRYFKLKEHGTTVRTEVIAGITTFITMAYIIFVNPNILGTTGMDKGAVFVATILSAIVATMIMGLFANVPFALAAGMGMNAFFTYYVVGQLKYSWQSALAMVFLCGIINIVITVTKLRIMIVKAIPDSLKNAIGAGIGLFISLIGFVEGGLVVKNPDTLVQLGDFSKPTTLLTLIGLIITALLMVLRVRGAILLGILITTVIGIPMGISKIPEAVVSLPPSLAPTFLQLDFSHLLRPEVGFLGVITIIVAFSLADTFDTIGTFIGTARRTNVFDDANGEIKKGSRFPTKMDRALFADAIATSIGALLGTSNVTTYVESTAGISAGGRTGLTSVITSAMFVLALFFAPIVGIVPSQATAPALIIVGVLMLGAITNINFEDFSEALPAFATAVLMPFTYNITNGIAAGFIFYTLVKIVTGKAKEVHPMMYIFAILFVLRYAFLKA